MSDEDGTTIDDVLEAIGDENPEPDPDYADSDAKPAEPKEDADVIQLMPDGPESDSTKVRFETKKFSLLAQLDKAQSCLPSKDIMPVLKNFLVEATPGRLRIITTDLEMSIIAESQMVTVQASGTVVIPSRQLLEIVREAKEELLVLEVEGGTATITVAKTQWELKLSDSSEYPKLPEVEDLDFYPVSRTKFLDAINSVRYAAARETVRPTLMMLDVAEGFMRASDGLRFQQANVKEWWPEGLTELQIPINSVETLVKLLKTSEVDLVEIAEAPPNHLVFKIGADHYMANKLDAEFPDVGEMTLKPALANKMSLRVDREELVSAIKRVRITADEQTSAVVIDLEPNKLVASSKDKFGNTAREDIDVFWDSPEHRYSFHAGHFLDMLAMTDAKSCHFKMGEGTKTRPAPVLLTDDDVAGNYGVLNQIRLDFLT